MIFCYTHIQVLSLVIIRKASSCSRWEQIQRPTVMGRESKLNVSTKSLLSELRESSGRGGEKILRARGDEGHQENKAL